MPKDANSLRSGDSSLIALIDAIVRDDRASVSQSLRQSPGLARQAIRIGASRQNSTDFFFKKINHYIYAGDTALHLAAAAHRADMARQLIAAGADVSARNRRGAQPLHYAADGGPDAPNWNGKAQSKTIVALIRAGSDPNTRDKSGVAPLHRAVRQRSPMAVRALLENGAEVRLRNGSGSTPLHLAVQNTGCSGSGSPGSKDGQEEIIELLLKAGATPQDRDSRGRTVKQWVREEWVKALLESAFLAI